MKQASPFSKPIVSKTCEKLVGSKQNIVCGKIASRAYKTGFNGWFSICEEHSKNLLNYSQPISEIE